jgi:hypothetical protein
VITAALPSRRYLANRFGAAERCEQG